MNEKRSFQKLLDRKDQSGFEDLLIEVLVVHLSAGLYSHPPYPGLGLELRPLESEFVAMSR
jgi:hypothetical protein